MLLTLADSRLPTGAHVHSGGVEEAITAGLVTNLSSLEAFLKRRIRSHGLVTASIAAAVQRGDLAPMAQIGKPTPAHLRPRRGMPHVARDEGWCGWLGRSGRKRTGTPSAQNPIWRWLQAEWERWRG
ncbi:putative urease accessory protein ureF [Mycobacterium ulcerans str. Harvey]|uniref:Urease accessory protein ureF n=1 Tax=Mycobacterium ulcerans str. Harvey TaxID=1299332 RepID=A0ABP3AGY7_MYCUL|nr:putative urease accessory protein ureF [Mycobacterium ulcerans str. Harvey]